MQHYYHYIWLLHRCGCVFACTHNIFTQAYTHSPTCPFTHSHTRAHRGDSDAGFLASMPKHLRQEILRFTHPALWEVTLPLQRMVLTEAPVEQQAHAHGQSQVQARDRAKRDSTSIMKAQHRRMRSHEKIGQMKTLGLPRQLVLRTDACMLTAVQELSGRLKAFIASPGTCIVKKEASRLSLSLSLSLSHTHNTQTLSNSQASA